MILFFKIVAFLVLTLIVLRLFFIQYFTKKIVEDYLKGESPFIPVKPEFLEQIVETMEIDEKDTVYDLGCGDARMLVSCQNAHPEAKYIGIEKNFVPYFWVKLRLLYLGKSAKIKIIHQDFFKADLSDATAIFLYLIPKQIVRLEEKFERELKPGTKVLAFKYPLQKKEPEKVSGLEGDKIYFYKF